MAVVISVVNQKGGVGKTTTAVNLSAALARANYKVLLIDFDPQAHSTEHLGVRSYQPESKSVLEVLNGEQSLLGCVIPTYLPNLWVLPANLRLGQFNQNNPSGKQFVLRQNVSQEVKDKYDFVIIDCQPSLSLLTLNALTACDKVLLPVQAEYLALDGLSQLVITLKEVRNKLHPKLSVLGVVVTMFDRRNKLSFEIREELAKNFGPDLFETSIPRSVKFAEAPSFGKSIFEYAPDSPAAQAYGDLARELVRKISQK
jgi:chromosome partitioning protein